MLQIELKNANDHIAYLTNLTGEQPKAFGLTLMKVEEDYIDLGDGNKIKVTFNIINYYSLILQIKRNMIHYTVQLQEVLNESLPNYRARMRDSNQIFRLRISIHSIRKSRQSKWLIAIKMR